MLLSRSKQGISAWLLALEVRCAREDALRILLRLTELRKDADGVGVASVAGMEQFIA
jgi:hypothetical protein